MATLSELAAEHTGLDGVRIDHLQRLVGSWGMLADLCFADLLLFAAERDSGGTRFVVLGQIRPSTSQTLHRDDLVGRIASEDQRPLVAQAWRHNEILDGEIIAPDVGERARIQCIPVHYDDQLVAIMTRENAPAVGRPRPGELERRYVEIFDRFARMIVRGEYPFRVDDVETSDSPRVGDGVLLLDDGARVEYASPNAINALHRMGIYSNVVGMRLDEIGVDDVSVRRAFASRSPVTEEIERRADIIVLVRCIPLLDCGRVTGGIVLTRDITELRRRDRLLLSKDAAIREVHHRVKNNLQTISSLLRLQARRVEGGAGRVALEESERRIRSIALVHEILSRDAAEEVPFDQIVRPLVRMAEESVVGTDRTVRFKTMGDAGTLPADVATPLAVVLTELLQNAAEHAFSIAGGQDGEEGFVEVGLDNDGERLQVRVADNGTGLPEGFSVETTASLGLSLVREMVTTQLGGTIEMESDGGTVIRLVVPLDDEA